jgi:hypothetical protein
MVMRSRADGNWVRATVLARASRGPFADMGVDRIAMNARGDVFAVWETGRGVHAYLNGRYQPAGGPWIAVRRLTQTDDRPNEYAAAIVNAAR